MTLKSLTTSYAGCLFRSRLEARWAVVLEHLGIEWEYEPQGYQVTNRLQLDGVPDAFSYLPDFWLPGRKAWLEVKGEFETAVARRRFLSAAASLSSEDQGGCGDGPDVIIAGPLTASGAPGLPVLLHMHKGDLEATCMFCGRHYFGLGNVVAVDTGDDHNTDLLRGIYCRTHASDPTVIAALDAGRTARFEHGARPKAVRP